MRKEALVEVDRKTQRWIDKLVFQDLNKIVLVQVDKEA